MYTKLMRSQNVGPEMLYDGVVENVRIQPSFIDNRTGDRVNHTPLGIMVSQRWTCSMDDYPELTGTRMSDTDWWNVVAQNLMRQAIILDDMGMIHTDMHKGNVYLMLDEDGNVVSATMADFGEMKRYGPHPRRRTKYMVEIITRFLVEDDDMY